MRNVILLLFLFITTPAFADLKDIKSIYTDLDPDLCKLIDKAKPGDGEWVNFNCKGYENISVLMSEADLRYYLSYGPKGNKLSVWRQTLPQFNTIGKKLEWRLHNRHGQWVPFATILRYYTDSDGQKGQILVVTKIGTRDACHIAYIDALANKNVNQLARDIANTAHQFNCKQDKPKRL